MNEFVYANKVVISREITIKKYEIGILVQQNSDTSYVHFVNHDELISLPSGLISYFDPEKTGDQFDYKVCNRCNRLLPVQNFQKNQNGKNNRSVRRPSCNDCRELIDGIDIPGNIKREWEKTKPHLEIWECPICKKKTIPGLTSKVVLDHNHTTGEPRAWICDSCNTGLGRFKDDIDVMKTAIDYLKKDK